jgi:photosystem II stability/assembly factor-like uncharacterized protein
MYRVSLISGLITVLLGATIYGSCRTEHWQLVGVSDVSHEPPILSLVFTDRYHGWTLTPTELLQTEDGGKTWRAKLGSESPKRTFYYLTFASPSIAFVAGSQERNSAYTSLILRSSDGGESWQETPVNISPVQDIHLPHGLRSMSFCNSTVGWAAGPNLIARTMDGGQTWETERSEIGEILFGIVCSSSERAWAVGQDGLILHTTDSGKTWSRQDSGTRDNLACVRFFDKDGWIVGGMAGRGVLLRTHDGGACWQPQELNLSGPLFDIHLNGEQGWIVGAGGTILATDNGGQTWTRQQSPTANDLTCLFFLPSGEAWAGGDKRTLLHFSK